MIETDNYFFTKKELLKARAELIADFVRFETCIENPKLARQHYSPHSLMPTASNHYSRNNKWEKIWNGTYHHDWKEKTIIEIEGDVPIIRFLLTMPIFTICSIKNIPDDLRLTLLENCPGKHIQKRFINEDGKIRLSKPYSEARFCVEHASLETLNAYFVILIEKIEPFTFERSQALPYIHFGFHLICCLCVREPYARQFDFFLEAMKKRFFDLYFNPHKETKFSEFVLSNEISDYHEIRKSYKKLYNFLGEFCKSKNQYKIFNRIIMCIHFEYGYDWLNVFTHEMNTLHDSGNLNQSVYLKKVILKTFAKFKQPTSLLPIEDTK